MERTPARLTLVLMPLWISVISACGADAAESRSVAIEVPGVAGPVTSVPDEAPSGTVVDGKENANETEVGDALSVSNPVSNSVSNCVSSALSDSVSGSNGATDYLGVLVGPGDGGHDGTAFYGTDLGYTYEHAGKVHILFGDTWANAAGTLIGGVSGNDDSAGTIDCLDGDAAETYVPDVALGTTGAQVDSIQYSHKSDVFKTPMTGFSNGTDEYALFFTGKPRGCRLDSDCGNGLTCDRGLGFFGEEYFEERGFTVGCVDGQFGCLPDTMADAVGWPVHGTGLCIDTTSSQYQPSASGRIASAAIRVHVGVRSTAGGSAWVSTEWLTHKFQNVTARVGKIDGADKVLLWGRPGFVGVGARGRRADLYFAYADMPSGNPDFAWQVHYFTGVHEGRAQFATDETRAVSVDRAEHDIVNQQSVVYVAALGKWVMLWGGGITNRPWPPLFGKCGALEVLVGADCMGVERGNGAIRMSTADDPWGPWSSPVDVLVGGDPAAGAQDQYAPGGILRHPDCVDATCVPHSPGAAYGSDEYGFLYGVNIVDSWTKERDGGVVDLYWNVSAWDPYNVVLFKTRIR